MLAIEDVANDEDKAFLIGTLVIRIVEHLRLRARAGQAGQARAELRHVLVIEEAHRLLRATARARARTPSSCSPACWPRSAPTARAW